MNPIQMLMQAGGPEGIMQLLQSQPQLLQLLQAQKPLLAGQQPPMQQAPQTVGSTLTPAPPGYAPKITQTRGEAETSGNLGQLLGGM